MPVSRVKKGRVFQADDYMQQSRLPLQSLIFLVPIIITYEIGAYRYLQSNAGGIYARRIIDDSLRWLGAGGYFIPVLVLVTVLISIHIANKDKIKIRAGLYVGMTMESIGLAMPLLIIAMIWVGQPVVQEGDWKYDMIISLGAGIYEELVFRLIAIAVIHMIIVDILGASHRSGAVVAIIGSAVIFAMYHFTDENPFHKGRFAFYTLSGMYLALIYDVRGFGIAAATHAIYDVVAVAIARGLFPAE